MKLLISLALLASSTLAFASQDKCYETAKQTAFEHALNNEEIQSMDDFTTWYGDESVEVFKQNGWQKEYWTFSNSSRLINVEIDAVKGKCFVKNVDLSQNDQDWD